MSEVLCAQTSWTLLHAVAALQSTPPSQRLFASLRRAASAAVSNLCHHYPDLCSPNVTHFPVHS
jgi:hypothetical protein